MGTVQTLWHRLLLELGGQWLSRAVQNRARYVIKRSCAHLLSSFLRGHMIAQPIMIIQILWLIVWFFDETSPEWMILLRWLHRYGVRCYLERILILIVIRLEERFWAGWPAIHLYIIAACAKVVIVALLLPQWKHLIIIFWVALLVLWHLYFWKEDRTSQNMMDFPYAWFVERYVPKADYLSSSAAIYVASLFYIRYFTNFVNWSMSVSFFAC